MTGERSNLQLAVPEAPGEFPGRFRRADHVVTTIDDKAGDIGNFSLLFQNDAAGFVELVVEEVVACLLYTSPSPRD